jgi:UDP-N-acetylglucosamine 3-dehydrogenase
MLKVGVIGVGSMGQNHARIYSEMGCLAGVYDIFSESAQKVAKKLGTTAYSDIDSLISKVDALSICTPTDNHYDVAVKAIGQGRSLLVEKPFTGDVEKARNLCELAEKKGVALASGFVERFNPVVAATKEAVSGNKFGQVVSIASRRVSSFPSRIRDVGVIMDLAIHDVDVIRYLTGKRIDSVYALGGKMANDRFEDHATLLLGISGGSIGMVEVNWLTPMKVRKVTLTCSKGLAEMDYMDQGLRFSSARMEGVDFTNLSSIPMELDAHHILVKKEEPLKRELKNFLDGAEGSSKLESDGWNAVDNIAICSAALQSMQQSCRIDIPR